MTEDDVNVSRRAFLRTAAGATAATTATATAAGTAAAQEDGGGGGGSGGTTSPSGGGGGDGGGGGGGGPPDVPGTAKALGVASTLAMVVTLLLAYFFLKFGGDYGDNTPAER